MRSGSSVGRGRWCIVGVPPGIIRSAPPIRIGITADGVDRVGRRVGCFQRVYTRPHRQAYQLDCPHREMGCIESQS